ncbi:MAG: TonB family protein [bacterium]
MRNIYISRNNRRFGPYSVDDIKYLAREGRLNLDDWIWLPGKNNWIKISSVESIAMLIKSEHTESEDYYLHRGGFKIGPFTRDMVLSQLKSGELSQEDIIEHNGKLKNLKEVFPDAISSILQETKKIESFPIEEEAEIKQEVKKRVADYPSEETKSDRLFKSEDEIREFKYRKYIEEIDDENAYIKSFFTTTFIYAILLLSAFYIRTPEPRWVTEIAFPERVAELLPDASMDISIPIIEELGTGEGEGEGTGGGGKGAGGGAGVGLGPGATGVLGLITKIGPGGTVADMLGGGVGDIDSILGGLGGLKTSGLSSSGTGGGGGFGLGGGLGLGGGIADIDSLIAGMGGSGGSDTVKLKKEGGVKISGPSGITGAGAASGQRTSAIIRSVVESHRSGIEYTYKKYLKTNPILQGKLVVQFVIAASGQVTNVQVISSSLGTPSLEKDVVNLIYGWRFPPIPEGDVTVIYPFVFFTTQK